MPLKGHEERSHIDGQLNAAGCWPLEQGYAWRKFADQHDAVADDGLVIQPVSYGAVEAVGHSVGALGWDGTVKHPADAALEELLALAAPVDDAVTVLNDHLEVADEDAQGGLISVPVPVSLKQPLRLVELPPPNPVREQEHSLLERRSLSEVGTREVWRDPVCGRLYAGDSGSFMGSLPPEDLRADPLDRLREAVAARVLVDRLCDSRRGVPEHLGHVQYIDAGVEPDRGVRVP